ncbi:hypothetical protein [Bradyrhizobium diazoefficiens]|uniref:hypothetical protein n=1 Tax=Bradyrhizobium diazoefficiens TaxID=1355477 RepID=UPI001B60985C|nr:hypothetical protein [Bradyrhizobium japonicum]
MIATIGFRWANTITQLCDKPNMMLFASEREGRAAGPRTAARHAAAGEHRHRLACDRQQLWSALPANSPPAEQLRIRSLMSENGAIFSGGVEADRLDLNAGAEVTIGIAARRGRLIV